MASSLNPGMRFIPGTDGIEISIGSDGALNPHPESSSAGLSVEGALGLVVSPPPPAASNFVSYNYVHAILVESTRMQMHAECIRGL